MAVVYSYQAGEMPTAREVTNFYLYGQKDKPADMLDPSTWAVNDLMFIKDGKIEIEIDHATFIDQMARFFDASSFDLIRIFMRLNEEYDGSGTIFDDTYKEYRDKRGKFHKNPECDYKWNKA